ncbi:Killing trait [Marinomonas spartinae]|uniref:RebB family R body protein n=1 Tax=Marinomonas spartinae TaxID=1792290 RepID=UPI000808A328|nr:RebB family R body protein [Marinomonas spartinae]SBS31119.1 Killing trait [Marinomonas spartinae]
MTQQNMRFENEFEQELSATAMEEFNTLQSFSMQPTSLLETTLTDTLGLSMHNAVTNQQQSHMTTAASITNACARLLQTKTAVLPPSSASKRDDASLEDPQEEADKVIKPTKKTKKKRARLSLFGFLRRKKGVEDEQAE